MYYKQILLARQRAPQCASGWRQSPKVANAAMNAGDAHAPLNLIRLFTNKL